MSNVDIDLTEINKIVDDFMYSYMTHIVDTNHSATGNLALNQTKLIVINDHSFEVYLQLEDYWKYLENGTKPHFPPISAIREWIRVKPVLPRPYKGKLPTETQLAYMIANKIDKVGTQATHLLRNTIKDFNLTQKLQDAIANALEERMDKYIKQYLD